MVRTSKILRILLIVLLLSTLVAVYGWSRWQNLKHELGLAVNWQGLGVGLSGLTFKQLNLTQTAKDGSLITVNSQDITLSWSTISVKDMAMQWQQGDFAVKDIHQADETVFNLNNLLDTISWAPNTIHIEHITVMLPCATGQCNLTGTITVLQEQQPDLPLSLQAELVNDKDQLTLDANLYKQDQELKLQSTTAFNQQPLLSINTQIDSQQLKDWQGKLDLHKIDDTQALFNWLHDWLPAQQAITEIPKAMEGNIQWKLHFPNGISDFRADNGFLDLDINMPNPWPIIKLGHLEGIMQTKVTLTNYRPRIEKLDTELKLTDIDQNLLAQLPKDLQPATIQLKLQPLAITDQQADRALTIQLNTEGALNSQFTTNVFINSTAGEIQFSDGLLQANTKKITVADYQLQNARLSLPFTAKINPKQATITLDKSALITLQQITSKEFGAKNLQLSSTNLITTVNYENSKDVNFSVAAPIKVTTSSLTQALLKPVSWQLTGNITADKMQTSFAGKVNNGAELAADITLDTDYTKQLAITAKTPDLFFRTSNIFAKTFKEWPELLEIATGKININGSVTIPLDNNSIKINAIAKFSGLSGIYDRSEFRDLSGTATITLQNNRLKIASSDLALTEANPGFIMGPAQFNGDYTASLNNISAGIISWSKLKLGVFTGEVWLKPGQLNLAKLPQQLSLQLTNIQLTDILKAYPSEGLDGEGILDGSLPVIISKHGIDIKDGKIGARKTGFIKFDSPSIKAMGQNNSNMKLVTDALENFQYTLLNSQVSYDQGTAILGLQINGRNPNVKNGQPINLNITLQEDIPALMTTLQLSDRVSETIRNRVQKRLQQRPSKN